MPSTVILLIFVATKQLSRDMTKPTKWMCAQWRHRSDWADAQADLSLCWAHTHFVGFVMWLLICRLIWPIIDSSAVINSQKWSLARYSKLNAVINFAFKYFIFKELFFILMTFNTKIGAIHGEPTLEIRTLLEPRYLQVVYLFFLQQRPTISNNSILNIWICSYGIFRAEFCENIELPSKRSINISILEKSILTS